MGNAQEDAIMEQTRQNIIALFDASGKGDAELEREMGLPRSIIYDWRNKRSRTYRNYLFIVALYFNVSLDRLTGIGQKKMPATERDRLKQENIKIMDSLPEDYQKVVNAYLQALADTTDKNKKK